MALRSTSSSCSLLFGVTVLLTASAGSAQEPQPAQPGHEHHHDGGASPGKPQKSKAPAAKKKAPAHQHKHSGQQRGPAPADHSGHSAAPHDHDAATMKGFLGPYPMNREASGTSWQPDTSPQEGVHATIGDWMVMWHALINGVYDNQGGPRGDQKGFTSGMIMGMAQR